MPMFEVEFDNDVIIVEQGKDILDIANQFRLKRICKISDSNIDKTLFDVIYETYTGIESW